MWHENEAAGRFDRAGQAEAAGMVKTLQKAHATIDGVDRGGRS